MFRSIILLLPVLAAATPLLVSRQGSSTTCGSNKYSVSQLTSAVQAGCNYSQQKKTVGSDKYPHTYNDYEGFGFGGVTGPYLEFPILESGSYKGGSPGADRVIFTKSGCQYVGTITHTGASGDDFIGCTGTS